MYPVLINFNIFGWPIGTYGFFIVLSLLSVTIGTYLYSPKRGFSQKTSFLIITFAALAAALGARLLNWLVNLSAYQSDRLNISDLEFHGFSLYGGLLLGMLVGLIVAKILKQDIWKMGDTFAPFMGLGIAIMRVGCFLKGCCFGKYSNLPWAVKFPLFSPAHLYQLQHDLSPMIWVRSVHPTQLYELLAALLGSLLSIYLIKKKKPAGVAILSFGIWFTSFRLFNHFLRVFPDTYQWPIYYYVIFYSLIILICLGLLVWRLKMAESKQK